MRAESFSFFGLPPEGSKTPGGFPTMATTPPKRKKAPAKKPSRPDPPAREPGNGHRRPRPPENLGKSSQQVWRETVKVFDLRADELRILEDACREVDLIDRMEKILQGTPLIVDGSQGQPRESPIVKEIRQHRLTFQRLMGSLKLPEESEVPAERTRTISARAAANARWHGRARGTA